MVENDKLEKFKKGTYFHFVALVEDRKVWVFPTLLSNYMWACMVIFGKTW